jgi:hypothetical protein
LTAIGITLAGPGALDSGVPHISESGTVSPWSTSITLTHGEVEVLLDEGLPPCASPGRARRSTTGTGRGPQPSSAARVLGPDADREGGHHLQAEVRGVVVENQEDRDVGLVLGFIHFFENS